MYFPSFFWVKELIEEPVNDKDNDGDVASCSSVQYIFIMPDEINNRKSRKYTARLIILLMLSLNKWMTFLNLVEDICLSQGSMKNHLDLL